MSFVGVAIGAGALVSGVGLVKAGQAAKKMDRLADTVPQAQRSQYPGLMIAQAQNELNANNPFLASENRAIQGMQANSTAQASKIVTDPTMLLSMVNGYTANAKDMALKNNMANYQARSQKVQDLYNAQRAGQQQDQMDYDNSMTAFNSKANIQNAASQTRVSAWMNAGDSLMSAGAAGIKGGLKPFKMK